MTIKVAQIFSRALKCFSCSTELKMWLKIVTTAILICSVFAGPHLFDFDHVSNNINPLAPSDPEGLSFRLPNNSIPIHYNVFLSTDIHIPNFNFNGSVAITFRTLMPSTNITINFKQISIYEVHLYNENSQIIESFVNFELDYVTELMVIRPQFELPGNQQFIIRIEYSGVMRTDSYGYYQGSYIDENGNQRWFGATQFQATDARHAFPW